MLYEARCVVVVEKIRLRVSNKGKKDKPVEVDCRCGMEEGEGRAGERQALYVERVSTLSK
jgi:hypothetical protein